ncbi:MAG: hypothetical protein RR275_06750 [Lachnospiraceae bacterium]
MQDNKYRKESTSGTTLVELVVAFALAAVFMTAAVALISPFTNVYLRVVNMNRIHNISNVVMEKVVNELAFAGASNSTKILLKEETGAKEGYRSAIEYSDYTGSRVTMNTQDGELVLTYAPTEIEPKEIVWQFGTDFYQGNKVELAFQHRDNTNQIKIYLKVYSGKNEKAYFQTTETYVECVDVDSGDIMIQGKP